MSSNKQVIEDLYHHFKNKNSEGIRALFAEDIEWTQMQGFPNGGRYVGFEAIAKNVFQGFSEHWTDWGAHVVEYLEAGNDVVAIGYYSGTFNATQRSVKAAFAHRYTLRDQKIQRFTQYTDTRLVAEAMSI